MGDSKPPQFDGRNFSTWAVKMEYYLRGRLLWDHFRFEVVVWDLPEEATTKDIKRRDKAFGRKAEALSYLHSCVTEEIFVRILSCKSAKQAWDKLAAEYRGDDKSRDLQISTLLSEFESIKM